MRTRLALILLVIGAVVLTAGSGWTKDLLEEGLAAHKAKNYPLAVNLLSQHLKKYPHTPEAWQARALSLAAQNQNEEALRDLAMGLKFNPKEISLMMTKGKVLGKMGRYQEAVATFSKVLDMEPSNTEALKERADNLIQDSKVDMAILDLNQAVAMEPTDPWAYYKLGMAELCLNHFKEAEAAFGTAIRLSPETPFFYFARGKVYLHHLNSPDEAKADFKKGCDMGHSLCCQELEKMAAKSAKSPDKKK